MITLKYGFDRMWYRLQGDLNNIELIKIEVRFVKAHLFEEQ